MITSWKQGVCVCVRVRVACAFFGSVPVLDADLNIFKLV